MKECIFCGHALPDDAEFCFACAKTQNEKREIKPPALRYRMISRLCLIVLLVLAAAAVILLFTGRKTIGDGGAEAVYRQDGAVWHVLLRNATQDSIHWQTPQGVYKRMIREEQTGAIPLQLYVYDEQTGKNRAEEFRELLDRSEITVTAAGGSNAADYGNPAVHAGFPEAALVADIVFDSSCRDNEIVWTLYMKNGDTLELHEQMVITVMDREEYSWKTVKLDTSEDLQTLIDRIGEDGEDREINIYLGPATYENEITISSAAVNLIGCEATEGRTVFRGGVRIATSSPYACNLERLVFEGGGTGVTATKSCFVFECTFIGLDVGLEGANGSWPMPAECTFENCGTGFHMDSSVSESKYALFDGNIFRNNGTAVLLERMPSGDDLYFVHCVFEGNGTDMDSRVENRILYEME